MKFKLLIIFTFLLLLIKNSNAGSNLTRVDDIFYIGKMDSHNKDFVLFFKTREKAILARGEDFNYITDYPQDLYIYDKKTKVAEPLITYEWFPRHAKFYLSNYDFPVFPEDFAYYLMQDNKTLIMISAIKNSEIPVATIVEGKAMSCGAILFSFGTQGYRFMDPDATVMIHDVSSMDMGKVEELKAGAAEADRLNNIVYTMMAQKCGKKDDYFMKIVDKKKHADWFLDAAESKKHGLANHLRVPKLNISVSVDIDFE